MAADQQDKEQKPNRGVQEVAPALGISETTVKTHLQRIFRKTGTARQADLVKLVAGFLSPLNA